MDNIEILYDAGRDAVKQIKQQPICNLEQLRPHLTSAAITMDKFATPIVASIMLEEDTDSRTHSAVIKVDAKFKGDMQIYTAHDFAAKAKRSNREPKLRFFYKLMIKKMSELLKDYHIIYIEDLNFNAFETCPKLYKKFGIRHSYYFTQMYNMFFAAVEKVCKLESKKLIAVQPNRRAHRCMYCGIELHNNEIIDNLMPTICPYCEKHHDKVSLYLQGDLPYYSSVAILMLKEMIGLNMQLDNFNVDYVENSNDFVDLELFEDTEMHD